MPIRPIYTETGAPPVIVEPSPTPAPPPPAVAYVEWVPAGGPTLILSQPAPVGIHLGGVDAEDRTIVGLDMPPQEEFDTQLPAGGELANGRRWAARPFALPVVIHADTLSELEGYRRQLMGSFNPARGEGVFTIAYPIGTRRHLDAKYSSGLDVAELGRSGSGLYRDSYMITLKARNPFPYGDAQTIRFNPPTSFSFFAPPGDTTAVFYISSGSTSGDESIFIDGEVEGYPEWRIGGPCSTATLRNRDTGKTLSLTPNLASGQVLIIRTDPRTAPTQKFTINGANVWNTVAGQFPVMWSLQPGENRVTVQLAGTTPGQSYAEIIYRPRYLNA